MTDQIDFIPNKADIEYSKPSKSRYLFLLFFFGFFFYVTGCSLALYSHRYKPAKVDVPSSTLYNPEYK